MGTMLHFGSTVSREFAKAYLMKKEYATLHDEGAIHIHDMDFLAMGTTTCMQIDLNKLLIITFLFLNTKLDKDNKLYLPLAIRNALKVKANERIDYYISTGNTIVIKKRPVE